MSLRPIFWADPKAENQEIWPISREQNYNRWFKKLKKKKRKKEKKVFSRVSRPTTLNKELLWTRVERDFQFCTRYIRISSQARKYETTRRDTANLSRDVSQCQKGQRPRFDTWHVMHRKSREKVMHRKYFVRPLEKHFLLQCYVKWSISK